MNNIKQNLEILLAAVEAQPETLFDLSVFRSEEPCGTLFCTVGLATTIPHFQRLGLSMVDSVNRVHYKGADVMDYAATDEIFGKDAWYNLFAPASYGHLDEDVGYSGSEEYYNDTLEEWINTVPNMTDKELAIARLKHQLGRYSEPAC